MRVLYVDIDSLNPDHLGCYGYHRPTSPAFDAIAAEGVRFTRCYTSDSPCVPSRAAFSSVRYGISNGVATHWGPGSEFRHGPAPQLAERLHRHGVRTVAFTTFAERHSAFWHTAGFAEYHNHLPGKCGNERADEVNAAFLPWLRREAARDGWFCWLNYWDPHRVYRMPVEYQEAMLAHPPPAWPDAAGIERHYQSVTGPFSAWGLWPGGARPERFSYLPEQIRTVDDWNRWVSGYDGSIRFCDDHLAQVVEVLQQQGVWDETVVIISADHGEHQGTQGIYGDHTSGYEATNRIPLVIRAPGLAAPGGVSESLCLGLDVAATIPELFGVAPHEEWDGRSLAPLLRGEQDRIRDHLVLTHGLYTCQRSVRTERWKLMRTYHPGLYDYPPLELFDMAADPREEADLAGAEPARVAELDHLLAEWQQRHLPPGAPPDPLWDVVRTGPWKYVTPARWNAHLARCGKPVRCGPTFDG